ncbi:MAG: carboxypeptidase regulatory-like domain-containing protein [Candidatus Cloacimonetes bacterium]|nr:carboxypeptidase regulatory-like domain-containing protein [Candidatus Cloacimonadota bacterium]
MKKVFLLVLAFLFVSSIALADKVVNPNQGLRDGLREQGDTCADPLMAVVGENAAPYQPVWYEYVATMDGMATISSCYAGQYIDTYIYVYDACEGNVLAYNDDIYCTEYSYASEVVIDIATGTSYYIYWDDYYGSEPFSWTITEELILPEIIDYDMVSSIDLVNWLPVFDDEVVIDPMYDYTYLNIGSMATSMPLSTTEMNEFFVSTYPEGWFDYWAGKGVIEGAVGWQAVMWPIINGNAPIFYLTYDGMDYMLVDGLQYQAGMGIQNLRVSGDYLLGDYTYTGTVLSDTALESDLITIPLTFAEPWFAPQGDTCEDPLPLTLPVVDLYGTSDGFSDDYTYTGSYYMNGIDIVYEMTIDTDGGFLQGSLVGGSSDYPGLFILDGCPDGEYNTIFAQGASTSFTFASVPIDAGTYYVIVSNWPTPDFFEYTLNMEWYEWVPEPGETCGSAIPTEINGDTIYGSIISMQHVWYEFTLDTDYQDVVVSLCGSSFDTKLYVYDECGAAYIGYNDDSCGMQSEITFATLGVGTYYVEVMGYSSYYGDYVLNITGTIPPTGESCELALPYYNINDPAQTGTTVAYETVWYEFYLDATYYNATVSLLGSSYDTMLEVWGDCDDADYLAYNDDWNGRSAPLNQEKIDKTQSRVLQSQIVFPELAPGYYYANVMGYSANYGDYILTITGDQVVPPEIIDYSLVSSIDMATWDPVFDDLVEIDPMYDYTYLNIFNLNTNVPLLVNNMNEFFVSTYPEGWFDYWAAKGVIEGATGWQAVMWEIINGNAPIFYIVDDGRGFMLVDGLLYQIGEGVNYLRVSGDYLLGDYTYTGTVTSFQNVASDVITLPITFSAPIVYLPGDVPQSAFQIDALPFFDTGDTRVDFTNWGNNSSPDVFYTFTLAEQTILDIHSCGSTFDTYLRLFNDSMTQVAYNDDGCYGWPTGYSSASYINQYNAAPGTYFLMLEGYSSYSGYYELTVEEYIPPTYGDLSGIVTDSDSGLPIVGATVNATVATGVRSKVGLSEKEITYLESIPMSRLATATDVNGYYEFLGLLTDTYDVNVSMDFYEDGYAQVDVIEGVTTQDFALVPITEWNVYLHVEADYYAGECSYNLWMPETRGWYWDVDQTFTASYEAQDHYLVLLPGTYQVYCWDTWGDGGITGMVQDENFVEMVSWDDLDYDDLGIFEFYNDLEPGSICQVAIDYGPINGPAQTGSIVANQAVWYTFTIDAAYGDVGISLLGSDFDTKLELWGDCGDDTYMAYNDDWSGRNSSMSPLEPKEKELSRALQSYIPYSYLMAGNYHVKVYGYGSSYGNYELEITGTLVIPCEVDGYVYDNETQLPLEGAMVAPGISGFETLTDINGYYYISGLPIGDYTFGVSKAFYVTQSVPVTAVEGLNSFNYYLDPIEYLEIGTGTSSTSYVPTYGYYDYTWTGSIYLQEEIGIATPITKMEYHVYNNPANYTMLDQHVYMAHTDMDIISANTYMDPVASGFQEVYSGTVVWNNGWVQIIFDTPFEYNGVDNLLIWWENYDGEGVSGYPTFYYTSKTSRAIYKYADTTFPSALTGYISSYVPNIRLYNQEILYGDIDGYVTDGDTGMPIEGATVSAGGGIDPVTTDAMGYYYISNLTTGDYTLTYTAPGYMDVFLPVTLVEGLNTFSVMLYPPDYLEIGTGTTYSNYVPCYGYYDYSWSGSIYLQEELGDAQIIDRIAYHVYNNPVNYEMLDQHVYMTHTDMDIFTVNTYMDPANTAGFQEVYCGNMIWNGGWNEITFDTPFQYNGTDNLMIWWDNFDGDYVTGYPSFYYTSQTSRAVYKYADNTFPAALTGTIAAYVPNIRIWGEPLFVYGDVDTNGLVEAFDTSNILQYVVGLDPVAVPLPWSEETMTAADVDGNDWINAYDGALILQYVVGYIDVFPVELLVRQEAPEAAVEVTFVDNELIFTATGDLYGFEADISANMGTPKTSLLNAVNGNKIALASAELITGEFLRIPVTAKEITIDMVINNANEHIALTSVPSVTALKSNYPNPFNPTTYIDYSLAEDGLVTVQIFNVKGQLVTTLVNEYKPAGIYQLIWNAQDQASGVYFFKMKSGRYTSTKKMILMK